MDKDSFGDEVSSRLAMIVDQLCLASEKEVNLLVLNLLLLLLHQVAIPLLPIIIVC